MPTLQIPSVTISHKTFSLTVPELELEPGEILSIFGKSGAGKTSYLKRVRELFDPKEVHYMSQFDGLLEEITIRQNIELGLAAGGHSMATQKNWEQTYAQLLKDFEVDRHLNKYPRALSGGQRKRSEIVRCLIMNPAVLLLDEPFIGIGHLFEAICTREILKRSEQKEGATIIVSHDFDLLCTFSKRILLVDDSGIIGMVPTREPHWHPENVRTAWTLGVENVLSKSALETLKPKNIPSLTENQRLGFWAWSAAWGEAGDSTLTIPRKNIISMRKTLVHGTLYTRLELQENSDNEPDILVAKGTPPEDGEVVLGMKESWVLNA